MYYEYDDEPLEVKKRKPVLGFGDIGGAGQIIYNLVRFEEYDWDNVQDRDVIIPMCDRNHTFILPNEKSPSGKLVFDTFDEAVENNPDAHPLFHSDRGFQYTSKIFRARLESAKMVQSMSRVGRCIDNGPMEGFWGILKSEMYYLRKFTDEQELISAIEHYIYFYNTKRYQKRLHCMTPMEFHAVA